MEGGGVDALLGERFRKHKLLIISRMSLPPDLGVFPYSAILLSILFERKKKNT